MATDLAPVEQAKRAAAFRAVDENVQDGFNVGVGSGSTVVYAVQRLAELCSESKWSLTCVPTSFQARQLINDNGLTLSDLSQTPLLDVAIDGADEVDANLDCIKGGGGAHLQEKLVASCARKFVIIADSRKDSSTLGSQWKKGVPLEVIPAAYVPVMNQIKKLGGAPVLRMAKSKAGPVVTDNGNFIVDANFGEISNPGALNSQLKAIVGVVETGLFVSMAQMAYFGREDGTVSVRSKPE